MNHGRAARGARGEKIPGCSLGGPVARILVYKTTGLRAGFMTLSGRSAAAGETMQ